MYARHTSTGMPESLRVSIVLGLCHCARPGIMTTRITVHQKALFANGHVMGATRVPNFVYRIVCEVCMYTHIYSVSYIHILTYIYSLHVYSSQTQRHISLLSDM